MHSNYIPQKTNDGKYLSMPLSQITIINKTAPTL